MPDRLRCAVIGTGGFGLDHLNSLLHCPRAAAVALAEINPERLKEAADRYKISRAYADYQDLLDQPDIDAVTIAVPNHLHARIAIDSLQARKHVLLEKPMVLHAREARDLVRDGGAEDEHGVVDARREQTVEVDLDGFVDEPAGQLAHTLGVRPRRPRDESAERDAELHRSGPDTAGRPVDEQALTRL